MSTETAAPVETLSVHLSMNEDRRRMFADIRHGVDLEPMKKYELQRAAADALKTVVLQFEPDKQFENKPYGSGFYGDTSFTIPADKSSDVINAMMDFSKQWMGVDFNLTMGAPGVEDYVGYDFRDGARRHQGRTEKDWHGQPHSAWTKAKITQNFSTTLAAVVKKRDDKAAAVAQYAAAPKTKYRIAYVFTVEGEEVFLARNEHEARQMFEKWGTRTRLSRHGDGGEYKVKVSGVEVISEKQPGPVLLVN
jgi:hypothetical protein